jgi:hypothetical protein
MTMRLQRLHFSSSPLPTTLAINCPHSQRVSLLWERSDVEAFGVVISVILSSNEIENDY